MKNRYSMKMVGINSPQDGNDGWNEIKAKEKVRKIRKKQHWASSPMMVRQGKEREEISKGAHTSVLHYRKREFERHGQ